MKALPWCFACGPFIDDLTSTMHASHADASRIPPRYESTAVDPSFSDFHLPLLDDRLSQKTPTVTCEHYENQSVKYDFGHPSKALQDQPCWTPFPLRRHVLLAFISVFTSMIVVLAVLFSYSRSHQGVSAADKRLYYVWTYCKKPAPYLRVLVAIA